MIHELDRDFGDQDSGFSQDLLADYTDPRLLDLFHATALLEESPETLYDQKRLLHLIRAAYWHGARDMARDPQGVMKTNDAYAADVQRQRAARTGHHSESADL